MVQGRRIAQWVLVAALLLFGLLIICRTLFGPLTSPFSVKSPMNVEGWFGLSAILLVLIQSRRGAVGPRLGSLIQWDAFAVAAIACLTASAFYRAAGFYFLSDDFILLKYAKSFSYNFHSLFATPGGDGFYRPLAYASMALTSSWAGVSPVNWHWIGFALHAANSILVFFL